MHEIRTIPHSDAEFRAAVEACLEAVRRDRLTRGREEMETTVTRVIRRLSVDYPGAWMRRQDALAADGGGTLWYVFRDAPVPRDPVLPMPRPRVERETADSASR